MRGSFVIYLLILIIVLVGMFASSSTPYQKQDIRGNISHWIDVQKVKPYLQGISFTYGNKEISVQAVGVAGFLEFLIRKATHFLTFMLLAFLLFQVFRYGMPAVAAIPWSGFLALATAVLDEWHQTFTAGRSGLIADVILDATGICLMLVILAIRSIRKSKTKASVRG